MTLGHPNKLMGATNLQILVYNRLIEYLWSTYYYFQVYFFHFYDRWFYVINFSVTKFKRFKYVSNRWIQSKKRNIHRVLRAIITHILDSEVNLPWINCKGKLKLQGAWAGALILSFVIAFLLVILIRILMVSFCHKINRKISKS